MLEIGTLLDGKYKILNEIGHGGMSTVYLAINEKANKTWAVKEVRKEGHEDFHIIQKSLIMEVEMLKKLSHPNLPSIVDIIDARDDFFIVMDYIDGRTLEDIMKERKSLTQKEVTSIAKQLGSVLSYLHEQSIIYRDLKPSNIMLKNDGSVVLIDFGTAREYEERKLEDTTCLGTRGYAAPEQFGGMGQTDARTDIYALGVTMYYLITSKNPAMPPYEIYPIRYWDEKLSSGLEHIISKCTNINPEDRYQSARDFLFDLENFHHYDIENLKKYKRQIKIVKFFATAGIFFAMLGAFGLTYGKRVQTDSYEQVISKAKKASGEEEIFKCIDEAVTIAPERKEAYDLLYDYIQEDGVFTLKEEKELLKIANSQENYLEKWKLKDQENYADFCFSIGNAYWFLFEHEENRESHALNWYEEAMNIYKQDKNHQTKINRCRLFIEIGSFYKKITTAQLEGEDAGMYKEYFEGLKKLKKENNLNPDRDLITLRMFREIVTNSIEYAAYLKDDGVSKEEIDTLSSEIEKDVDKITGTSKATKEEIQKIKELIAEGKKIINSTYNYI